MRFGVLLMGLAGLSGCITRESDDSSSCPAGSERCPCYANDTCDEGLECLSNHCVDTSPEVNAENPSNDSDASLGSGDRDDAAEADDTDADDTESRVDEPRDGMNDDGQGVIPQPNPPNPGSDEPAPVSDESAGPSTGPGAGPAEAGPAEAAAADDAATDDTVTDDTVTDDTVTDDVTTDDVTTDETGTDDTGFHELRPLPPRVSDALDIASAPTDAQSSCTAQTNPTSVCRLELECEDSALCLASFEWIQATVSSTAGVGSLWLRSLSGDGTVVAGDIVLDSDSAVRNAFLWRWGHAAMSYPTNGGWSSATALNFDATALVGAERSCDSCDYQTVVWNGATFATVPPELGSARDISDVRTVVGFNRDDQGVLWGYSWDGAEPMLAQTLALHQISGDGLFAAGVAESGPVVLHTADGTKSMLTEGSLVPYEVMSVSRHGEVVVGYGGIGSYESLFRWQVDVDVDVIEALPGFHSVVPYAVDASGRIMVGVNRVESTAGISPDSEQAFYWDQDLGMRAIAEELAWRGIVLPDGMHLHTPHLSGDATTVVGEGVYAGSPIMWRARLVQPEDP